MIKANQVAICLGLLAGSLTIAAVARADIPVTGGTATGDAAFFAPTSTGGGATPTTTKPAPTLFDAAIRSLRLETPNGTTTNSRFLPNASQFTDVNADGIPNQGDTGRLEGALSGVAFTPQGLPVFFQNVPTSLDFTLNSFTSSLELPGTLISPQQAGSAPLVFLPNTVATLSSSAQSAFTANFGSLDIGAFDAKVTGDFIGLPSDLQFRTVATPTVVPVNLGRRIKFDFEGKNVVSTTADFDATDGTLAFSGPTTKFQIQSVGTQGSKEFKIDGNLGVLDFELTGPFELKRNDVLLPGALTSYRIKGEGPGFTTLLGSNSVDFVGTSRRATDFKFEQGSFQLDGKSQGNVAFNVVGANNTVNYNSFTPFAGANTTVTVVTTPTVTSNTSLTSTSTFSSTPVATSTTTYINLFTLNIFDSSTQTTFTLYSPRTAQVQLVTEQVGDRILLVERERGRGLARGRRDRVVAAYTVIGLPSRVFPGLVGLRQISTDEVTSDDDSTTPTNTAPVNNDDDDNNSLTSPNESSSTTDDSSSTPSTDTSTTETPTSSDSSESTVESSTTSTETTTTTVEESTTSTTTSGGSESTSESSSESTSEGSSSTSEQSTPATNSNP
jgi:hypothetical protein